MPTDQSEIFVYPLDEPEDGFAPVFHMRVDMAGLEDGFRVGVDFAARLQSVDMCDALADALTAAAADVGRYLSARRLAMAERAAGMN